jgi:hypothetical protein
VFLDRDYRWYAEDMIHPSSVAESIVFDRFTRGYCDESSLSLSEAIIKINKRLEHRPVMPQSDSYRKHVQDTIRMIDELVAKHPFLSFGQEKQQLDKIFVE